MRLPWLNGSNNYALRKNTFTFGPMLNLNKRLLKEAMTMGLTLSYNQTRDEGMLQAGIFNLRYQASYRFLKRHSLNASVRIKVDLFITRKQRTAPH